MFLWFQSDLTHDSQNDMLPLPSKASFASTITMSASVQTQTTLSRACNPYFCQHKLVHLNLFAKLTIQF